MKLYRWPQGRTIRWCAAGGGMVYMLFAALRWYRYMSGALIARVDLPVIKVALPVTVGGVGAAVLAFGGLALIYYYFFTHPKTSDFLIESEGELRKVTWPAVRPWFRGSTELWGATYVVIAVVVILAVFTWFVDSYLLAQTVGRLFYGGKA